MNPRGDEGRVMRSRLFEPGLRLMDRLRYPQKFLLIGLVFFVPFAVIAGLHFAEQREAIETYRSRLQGLDFIRATSQLLRHVEMHQALSVAVLDGDQGLAGQLQSAQQAVEEDLARLPALAETDRLEVGEPLQHVRQRWKREEAAEDAQRSLKRHQGLITAVQDLVTAAADRSRLQLEEDAILYRLVNMITTLRRIVTQRITTLWCLGDLLRHGALRPEQKADIETLPDLVRNVLGNVNRTFKPGRRVGEGLFATIREAATSTETLLAAVEKDAAQVPFTLYENAARANWASWDAAAGELERLLQEEMHGLERRQTISIGAILLSLLVVGYLFLSFYASTLRTVRLLEGASRRMVEDAVVEQVSTQTHDEMAEVVEAFNQVAERLRVELAQAKAETERATVAESALRESEEKLREALVVAESANTAKSRFLANMSHELRTPLNAIIGYSEMLEEEANDRELDDFIPDLHRILGAARHLLALINDILDISKIEAGKMEIFRENIDVEKMLSDVLSTISPLAQKNENRLEVEHKAALGHVYSDVTKIRQSLLNLLSNACKFTEKGTVKLIAGREMVEDHEYLVFSVQDSGIGMSPAQVEKLFQEFSQADASTTRKYGGTGLGLAISRRFCQMLGGDIDVASEEGKGSTFTMRVRAEDAVQAAVVPAAQGKAGGLVLIIDDDPAALDLLSRFLRKEGFEVVTAGSGEEGLRLARERKPNVISLDIMLPGMDGWQVLDALKSEPELADIPVIVLTMLDDQQRGYALGATEFLVKPLDRERLARIVRRYRIAGRAARVLVVEDDADIRDLLTRQMDADGWAVDTAENGRIALDRCAAQRPDLILLDLMMPVMDGFEFIARLRATEEGRTIPVVVLTARDLSNEDRERLNGHVDRILQKAGQKREDLLSEVRGMLGRIQVTAARS